MIYQNRHCSRLVVEQIQLVHPEFWSISIYTENFYDDATINRIYNWVESHDDRCYIMFLHRNRNNYIIEFEREQEYIEFMLSFM